jgi:hypothetical protein
MLPHIKLPYTTIPTITKPPMLGINIPKIKRTEYSIGHFLTMEHLNAKYIATKNKTIKNITRTTNAINISRKALFISAGHASLIEITLSLKSLYSTYFVCIACNNILLVFKTKKINFKK